MANSKNITFDQLQAALSRVKSALDGKANTSHGNHVPKTETANNARFLRNDNTWQTITPVNIGAADRSHSHGSYVNQNAFTNIKVGNTTVAADSPTDTLTLTAGANVTLTPDATNDTVTIAAKDTVYTHPTTSGYKHIPSGGSSGQILRWSADGTAAWGSDNNTDTKVTNTLNTTAKAYVTGTTSATTNTGTQVFDTGVYLDTTAGKLVATTFAGSLSGNASSATQLQTARKFTIGNTERTFNGSGDVKWTLADIGAAPVSHNHTSLTGITKLQFATESSDAASISTTIDGSNTYFDFNLADDPTQIDAWRWRFSPSGGTVFNAMTLDASSATAADLVVSGSVTASSFTGNASSATKLQTARAIKIGNTSRNFDGTANVTWTLADIGAAASSHSHNYVVPSNNSSTVIKADADASSAEEYAQLQAGHNYLRVTSSGGGTTVTQGADKLTFNGNIVYHTGKKPTPAEIGAAAASHGTHVTWSTTTPKANGTAAVGTEAKVARGDHVHPLQTTVSGNAGTATKLQTARTLTIGNTGKTFDGSANVSWSLSEIGAAASGHTHNKITSRGKVAAETGTIRPAVDGLSMAEVYNNEYPTAYGNAITLKGQGDGQILVGWSGSSGGHAPVYVRSKRDTTDASWSDWAQFYTSANPQPSVTGNAGTATKLATARTLTIGNTGKKFDGSGNVSWSLSEIGAAASSHGTHVTYATATPLVAGTAAVGTSGKVAREDHVHPAQTSVTGNAGTATKLQNARNIKIGNTSRSFNGTADVTWTLGDIGAAASNHGHSNMLTFKSNHTSDWTSATSMSGKVYMGGWHGNISDSSKNKGYVSLGLATSGKALDFMLDGDFYANENNLVLNTGNYKSHVTPANIGAANASHGTHVTYGGNGSATTVSRSDHTHSYIPLGGSSSITGNLEFSNSGTTARGVIGTMGDNDFWRIVGGATATNAGYLEIATADDANEPIYVRQYGSGKFGTLTRTATLLDASGNTSFPGTVTAPTFRGALNGNASSATKLQTARSINDVSFDGSADIVVPIKFWKSTVGDNNNKPYHRILTSGVVTSQWTDKVITVMASSNYAGGAFGIFRVLLRTNGANADSSINIEWITRKGFSTDSIVANFIKTGGATQADIFYKSAGTYASVTWTILGEGDRSSGNYYSSWTKINTAAATTEVYTEAEMKALKSYTSTLLKGTDVAHVNGSNTSAQLTTARTINGTSFNGTGNITTANWGTARTLTIGKTGKSVNGSGNVSWSLSEIGAAASNHGHSNMLTFKSNHTSDWTSATSMANKAYMGGWHGNITDTSKDRGYISLALSSSKALDVHLDGDYYANENNLVLNAGNYNNYAPSKTGTGASGTWGISISGNSNTTNYLNSNTRMDYGWNGVNYFNIDAKAGNGAKVNDGPTKAWWHIMRFNHANGSGYYTDLAVPFNSTSLYYKRITNGAVQNGGWVKVLDSLNYNEYAAAKSHGNHVPATQAADNKKFLRNDNTWQTVTPANIGAAAANHSHSNYAASSHEHSYLNVKGTNTINSTANDTTAKWGEQKNSVHWYTEANKINGQPAQWGYLINIGQNSEVHQIWMTQSSGNLAHRGGNGSGWNGSWKTILDSDNYSTWAAAKNHTHNYAASNHTHNYAASNHNHDNAYLKLSGGTLSGKLTVNNTVQSQAFCVSKKSKEAWFDIGDNDTYIYASGANKSIQITHSGDLNFDGKPVLYGGRGNNYDTATNTIYFNNAGASHKGRISCYNNSDGDYVQLALRTADATTNYLSVRTDTVNFGSPIVVQGHKLTIQESAPSNPAKGDVWINIG